MVQHTNQLFRQIIYGLVLGWLAVVKVNASIVINEFMADVSADLSESQDEWVELFNTSDQTVDLNGYVLKDQANNSLVVSATHTSGTTIIHPNSHVIIYRRGAKFSLNNDEDLIMLYDSSASASPIDQTYYKDSRENLTWGRLPDGIGTFVNELIPSPGSVNIAPTPAPTPSPKPTATVKTTPKVSSNESITRDDKPSATPDQQAVLESKIQGNITGTNQVLGVDDSSSAAKTIPIAVLTAPSTEVSSSSVQVDKEKHSKQTHVYPYLLIIGGLSLTSSSLIWLKKHQFI